ncbi:LCR [Medicago truncatula]|uniref:LCR n=1 Tax=Medicago truncatula TaxID=3880 RepID=G8A2D4_MEDTR|nr:LCR [Medicago truncatula]
MASLKFILAAMLIAIFFLGVSSKQFCPGTCKNYPNCNAYCKKIGYEIGECIPPENHFCCCAKVDEINYHN